MIVSLRVRSPNGDLLHTKESLHSFIKTYFLLSKCPVLIKGNEQRATITFTVPLAIEWSTFVLVDNGRN